MERNIEHEVIKALAEKNIELTIRTNLNGYRIDCIVEPRSYDKMELHEFSGETLKAALANMLNDPAFMGKIDSDLLMVLCAEDEEKADVPIDADDDDESENDDADFADDDEDFNDLLA